MTSQYQGGREWPARRRFDPEPAEDRVSRPKRTPLKIDIFQISEAAT